MEDIFVNFINQFLYPLLASFAVICLWNIAISLEKIAKK
jgi:hypothetical protein